MYFRVTIPSLKEGVKEEAMSFIKEKVFPDFSGIQGLLSLTSMNAGENSVVSMAAWDSKESTSAQEEKFNATMAAAAQFFASPPQIFEEMLYLERFIKALHRMKRNLVTCDL